MNLAAFPREAFETMWENLPQGKKTLLMTSFEYNPDLFEREILPRLCGEEPLRINPARLNRLLFEKQVKALVVVDRSTNSGLKGAFNYGLLNVGLRNGRFHPKICLMMGGKGTEQKMYISVASANITFSGWSRNTEVIGWTQVNSSHISDLLALLEWIEAQRTNQLGDLESEGDTKAILEELIKFLDNLKTLDSESLSKIPQLFISTPKSKQLLNRILGKETWDSAVYYSPYWHSTVDLLDKFNQQGIKQTKVKFVATISRNNPDKFLFDKEAFDKSIFPYKYCPDSDSSDNWAGRFCHAKILILENSKTLRFAIGSHNATKAALQSQQGQGNIEAILMYDFEIKSEQAKAIRSIWCADPHLIQLTEDNLDLSDSGKDEGVPQLPPIELHLTAKPLNDVWVYKINVIWLANPIDNSKLIIGDCYQNINTLDTSYELTINQSMPIRTFIWKSNTEKYEDVRGTVLLTNCNDPEALGYYPPISVDRLLSELFRGTIGELHLDSDVDDVQTENNIVNDVFEIDEEFIEEIVLDDPYQIYKSWFLQKNTITIAWLEQLLKSLKKAMSLTNLNTRDLMTYLVLCQLLTESSEENGINDVKELVQICDGKLEEILIKDDAFKSQFSQRNDGYLREQAKRYLTWWKDEHSKIWSLL
jgi:hypothetical protein